MNETDDREVVMTTSIDEIEKKIRQSGSLVDRLDECHTRIGKMCSECRPPAMTIPAKWDDDDYFIVTTLKDAIEKLNS